MCYHKHDTYITVKLYNRRQRSVWKPSSGVWRIIFQEVTILGTLLLVHTWWHTAKDASCAKWNLPFVEFVEFNLPTTDEEHLEGAPTGLGDRFHTLLVKRRTLIVQQRQTCQNMCRLSFGETKKEHPSPVCCRGCGPRDSIKFGY